MRYAAPPPKKTIPSVLTYENPVDTPSFILVHFAYRQPY